MPPGDASAPRDDLPVPRDAESLPVVAAPTSLPSRSARGLALLAIIVGGVCGGLIGFAFTDLQCDDGCSTLAGVGGLIGAVVGAVGVAIVAVLTLRAMDEWNTIQARDTDA